MGNFYLPNQKDVAYLKKVAQKTALTTGAGVWNTPGGMSINPNQNIDTGISVHSATSWLGTITDLDLQGGSYQVTFSTFQSKSKDSSGTVYSGTNLSEYNSSSPSYQVVYA